MSDSREVLVLLASGEELHLVQARLVRDTVELLEAHTFLSGKKDEDSSALRDETILDALAECVTRRGWGGRDVVCLISGSSVACHYYDMPPLKGETLRQAALLKLDQQLHFDIGEAIVAVDELEERGGNNVSQVRVCVTAVHEGLPKAVIEAAARVDLDVKAISAAPAAIAALASHRSRSMRGLNAFLHVDERISTLVVLNGSSPCVTSELPIGMTDLTKALMRPVIAGEDIIQLDETQATRLRNEIGIPLPGQEIGPLGVTGDRLLPLLEPALQQFAKHLVQWLTFASTSVGSEVVKSLRLVGPGAAIGGFAETLASRLSVGVKAENWLKGLATLSQNAGGLSPDTFTAVIGAIRHRQSLPDLIPPQVHKLRKMRRIRRSVVLGAALATVVVTVIGVFFHRLGAPLGPCIMTRRAQLEEVQGLLDMNVRWISDRGAIDELQEQFDGFVRENPLWLGVFKEISVLLPHEVQVTEFKVRSDEEGMRLLVSGVVYIGERSRSFDGAVEQTLLLLQKSPFFRRVQLLAANREAKREHPHAAGTLTVELDLVYPHQRT
jgi:Tfp pilus assembly PilM family ATPase